MELQRMISVVNNKCVELNMMQKELEKLSGEITGKRYYLTELEKTKSLLIEITKQTLTEITSYIENVVTLAIQMVYGDEFRFIIEVKELHNQTEFHFYVEENGVLLNPKDETICGGMFDMMTLGLKAATFALTPNAEPILMLDEPFRFLGDKIDLAKEMIKEIQKILKIQIIIISHDIRLIPVGDTVINLDERNMHERRNSKMLGSIKDKTRKLSKPKQMQIT